MLRDIDIHRVQFLVSGCQQKKLMSVQKRMPLVIEKHAYLEDDMKKLVG